MTVFSRLAKKLINKKLWRNKVTVTQLKEQKQPNGSVIFIKDFSRDVNCAIRDIQSMVERGVIKSFTQFTFAAEDLDEFNISAKMLKITYNNRDYNVYDVNTESIVNNQPCVYKMKVLR